TFSFGWPGAGAGWDPAPRSADRATRMTTRTIGPPPAPGSIGLCRNDLAAGDRPQGAPDHPVDRALDEPHAAIAQQGVDSAGVVAGGVDRGEGRPAVLLVLAVEVQVHPLVERLADDRLVGRPGRREARRVDMAVGPLGVEFTLVLGHADAVVVLGCDLER